MVHSDHPHDHPYHHTTTLHAQLRNQSLQVVTKPGFPHWAEISPATSLLAEVVQAPANASIAVFGCGHGALGVVLARLVSAGQVTLVDTTCVATAMSAATVAANQLQNATVAADPASILQESLDIAVLIAPTGRVFARRWLAQLHAALKPGGIIYVAGANDAGIGALISDTRALFGQCNPLIYRAHHRVAVAQKLPAIPPPAWATIPGIAPQSWHEFPLTLGGRELTISSLPGIFAYDRLDEGTRFLLEHTQFCPGERVLDIGCGWGALGLAAAIAGAAHVDLIDSSLPAIAAVQRTITAAALPQASAFASDALAALTDQQYDLIVTNPPFHAGKTVSYDAANAFIAAARRHLAPRGRFLLVANAFIRYERALQEQFPTVATVAADRRYHLLEATLQPRREQPLEEAYPTP